MNSTPFGILVFEQLPSALIFFLLAWLALRKKDGEVLKVRGVIVIGAIFAAAVGSAIIRLVGAQVVGGDDKLNPTLFFIVFPALLGVAVAYLLRARAERQHIRDE